MLPYICKLIEELIDRNMTFEEVHLGLTGDTFTGAIGGVNFCFALPTAPYEYSFVEQLDS